MIWDCHVFLHPFFGHNSIALVFQVYKIKRHIQKLGVKPKLCIKVASLHQARRIMRYFNQFIIYLEKKCDKKIEMASGTTFEPKIESIALKIPSARLDRKQMCLCYDAGNKAKRNWSDNNFLKLTTKTAQPQKKHSKCSEVYEFAQEILTTYSDDGKMMSLP